MEKLPSKAEQRNQVEPHLGNEQEDLARKSIEEPVNTFRDIYCRVYVISFCVYMMAYNLIYYSIYSVVPFFLNKILKAEPHLISCLNTLLSLLIAVSMLILSMVTRAVDRRLPWLHSRLIFTLIPMILQIALYLSLSICADIYSAIAVLIISVICISTWYAGSIGTLNYEIDPENSPLVVSVYNSAGQIPGFVGPLLMTAFTSVGPDAGEDVVRKGWAKYFYCVAGMSGLAVVAILMALAVKPDEWVNRAKARNTETGDVTEMREQLL